jgi:hypothetical protein
MSPGWNWDPPSPTPIPQASVPRPRNRGGGHTRLRVRGLGSPNSNDRTKSLALRLLCVYQALDEPEGGGETAAPGRPVLSRSTSVNWASLRRAGRTAAVLKAQYDRVQREKLLRTATISPKAGGAAILAHINPLKL